MSPIHARRGWRREPTCRGRRRGETWCAAAIALALLTPAPAATADEPRQEGARPAADLEPAVPHRRSAKHVKNRGHAAAVPGEAPSSLAPGELPPAEPKAVEPTRRAPEPPAAASLPMAAAASSEVTSSESSECGGAARGCPGQQVSPASTAGPVACPREVPTAERPQRPASKSTPPEVRIGKPKYLTEGDVPLLPRMLDKARDEMARCVVDQGGLPGAEGALALQLLVRYRGRAEGVSVLSSRGLPSGAERCIRALLHNRWVGSPSADPVGLSVEIRLKSTAPAAASSRRPAAGASACAAASTPSAAEGTARGPGRSKGGASRDGVPLRRSAKHRPVDGARADTVAAVDAAE